MAAAVEEQVRYRKVGIPLLIGIIFLPGIFVWLLLRQNYSDNARWMGFLWAAFCAVIGLQAFLGSPKPSPRTEATLTEASARPSPTASPAPPAATRASNDAAAEARYLSLLQSVEEDMDKLGTIQQEDDARATWGSSLGSMGAIVDAYKSGAHLKLSPAGAARRETFKRKVADRQSKAFPQLRKIHGEDLRQRLWEHDVDVDVKGPGNSTLRLTGFWFASNRNIKQIADSLYEDTLALRYRRLEFRSYVGGRETYYDLEPLNDRDVATFSFNRWTPTE